MPNNTNAPNLISLKNATKVISLINTSRESLFNENFFDFDYFLQILRSKPFISIYYNGNRFFFFVIRNRLFYINEFHLCLIITSLSFIGTVAIKKLFLKFQIKRKIIKLVRKSKKKFDFKVKVMSLIQNIRGGEDQILSYDGDLSEAITNFRFENPNSLSQTEGFIKSIIQKCFQPKSFYRVTNLQLSYIIKDRIFKKLPVKFNSKIKKISYEIFTLVLLYQLQPLDSIIRYGGMVEAWPNLRKAIFVKNFPIFVASLIGTVFGILFPNYRFLSLNFIVYFLTAVGFTASHYSLAYTIRSLAFINCADYVQKLPTIVSLDPDTNQRVSHPFTLQAPNKNDIFVGTSRETSLYTMDNFPSSNSKISIQTLDGNFKETRNLKGDKLLRWFPNRQPQGEKIPTLGITKGKTVTLNDLIKNDVDLNAESDYESVTRILKSLENQQIREKILMDPFLE